MKMHIAISQKIRKTEPADNYISKRFIVCLDEKVTLIAIPNQQNILNNKKKNPCQNADMKISFNDATPL